MRREWLAKRLEELKPAGKTKSGLAEAMNGAAPARVTELISGKREPFARDLPAIAEYLEWPIMLLLAHFTARSKAELEQVGALDEELLGAIIEAVVKDLQGLGLEPPDVAAKVLQIYRAMSARPRGSKADVLARIQTVMDYEQQGRRRIRT